MDNTLFENPWDPSSDLLYRCYNQKEWEPRMQAMIMVIPNASVAMAATDDAVNEDDVLHVANIWGDLQGFLDLIGVVEKIMIPNIQIRGKGMNKNVTTPILTPDQTGPLDVVKGANVLAGHLKNKSEQAVRLRRLFYQEIYPNSWKKRGVLERMNGTRKWEWSPLLIQSVLFSNPSSDKKISNGILDHGYGSSMASALSTLSMSTMYFNLSIVVTVIRSLLHTLMEDDICMQTSHWFRNNEAYWKMLNEWLQGRYEELGSWQQHHDKRGVWNQPNGKLFRILRPFSTLFPCLSLVSRANNNTMDKTGVLRMLMYQSALYGEWMNLFVDYLWREQLDLTAKGLEAVVDHFRGKTRTLLENMSNLGITNIGYEQSILWSDLFLEKRMLPPSLFSWRGNGDLKALQRIKNVFSILAYQRTLLMDFIDDTYPLNDIFRPHFQTYSRLNKEIYTYLQEMEFQSSSSTVSIR